jgi:hypothetical protein
MRLLDDLYVRRIRRQHPGRNLQTLSGRISDTNRAVSALRFANHFKVEAVEGMERIENTNLLGFCAQGIVSVVTIIPTFTVSFPPADWHQGVPAGYMDRPDSSCP